MGDTLKPTPTPGIAPGEIDGRLESYRMCHREGRQMY